MKTMKHLITVFCFLVLGTITSFAEETYEKLTIGTNVFVNVRIIQATPVDLLVGHDEGHKRIKLQDLPEELKAKYPYDANKAAEYEKQKKEELRWRQGQTAAAIRGSLLSKEAQIQTKLAAMETELQRLRRDIASLEKMKKGKNRKSSERKQADQLRATKMKVRDQVWELQDELERTKAQRMKFE